MATFEPVIGKELLRWKRGEVYEVDFRLFGLISFGTHTIRIADFDRDRFVVRSRESNSHVPVWNHEIFLEPIDNRRTKYTDRVEIDAGWKTLFVYLWAKVFYAHRQRKWKRLLAYDECK